MGEKLKYSFIIQEDKEGKMICLRAKEDPFQMNWVEGEKKWGSVFCPNELETSVSRKILPNGHLQESYRFKNISDFPVFISEGDVGIYTTFNDNYEEADICLKQRCHTHIFCGGEASYVMALRMGGNAPNLGLMMVKGTLSGYSVERKTEELSNDRGDFILHPKWGELLPGETAEIMWELFWFEDRTDFEAEIIRTGTIPLIKADQCTFFPGEKIEFDIFCNRRTELEDIRVSYDGQSLSLNQREERDFVRIHCRMDAGKIGEYPVQILAGGKRTTALFYVSPGIRELTEVRCRFIADKQQYEGKSASLQGAYLIYDNEEEKIYYSHVDDHNGGRERLAMGALMALWLQKKPDFVLKESLDRYVSYVYRELYDKETGLVYNDISHNLDWHRKYNYPWMAVFQLELYNLTKDAQFLRDSWCTMMRYYEEDGTHFYAIGIPVYELIQALEKEHMTEEKEQLEKRALEHADHIRENGCSYPSHEVNFEQSIVAPGVSCLIQAYQISGEQKYIQEAEKQLKILYLFNGRQPDYHQFENAIRHWDGYWFGKSRMFGDTFPHYWSTLTGVDLIQYEQATGDSSFCNIARASLRGCLNLFTEDGRASCAMIFPKSVNGKEAGFYDVWANDQDWALYYALKYEKILSE